MLQLRRSSINSQISCVSSSLFPKSDPESLSADQEAKASRPSQKARSLPQWYVSHSHSERGGSKAFEIAPCSEEREERKKTKKEQSTSTSTSTCEEKEKPKSPRETPIPEFRQRKIQNRGERPQPFFKFHIIFRAIWFGLGFGGLLVY